MANDGGPAFPRPMSNDDHIDVCNIAREQDGMSLRDYFAAKAMGAMIGADRWKYSNRSEISSYAYLLAAAMLRAREKNE